MSIPVASRIAPPQGDPLPGWSQIDRGAVPFDHRRPEYRLGHPGDQRLEIGCRLLVIGVGLVPLEHRELGVVLLGYALVAEVLAQFVDLLDPADHAPLEVQLGRDPQVELTIERVVVGRERSGECAPIERLEDRCLHFEEAPLVEVSPDRRDRPGPDLEHAPRLFVGDQVQLAPAVAGLDVLESVELVGRWPERLGQHLPLRCLEREFPPSGRDRPAGYPDEVAEVDQVEHLESLSGQPIGAREYLDRPALVPKVEEYDLAVTPLSGHPPGDGVELIGLGPGVEPGVGIDHGPDFLATGEFVGEGVGAGGPEALQFLPALGQEVLGLWLGHLRPSGSLRRRRSW